MQKKLKKIIKSLIFSNGNSNMKISKKDISKNINKNNNEIVILEAGAADGTDTIEFSELFSNAKIYAFEPVTKNYNILVKRVKKKKNVTAFKLALSDFCGHSKIYISQDTKTNSKLAVSSSLLKPKEHLNFHPHIIFNEYEEVETTTIDKWAIENGIDHIDILWLDLQGMEFNVLKASPNILKTVSVLYTEVSLMEMYENGVLYGEYKDWLKEIGFEIVKEELLWKDMGNVLFIRK